MESLLISGLAEWNVPQGGMFAWVKVTAIDNTMDLVLNKCVPKGIFVLPGNYFFCDHSRPNNYLRLSYSYATNEDIDKVNSNLNLFIFII